MVWEGRLELSTTLQHLSLERSFPARKQEWHPDHPDQDPLAPGLVAALDYFLLCLSWETQQVRGFEHPPTSCAYKSKS